LDHTGETSPTRSCADGSKTDAVPLENCDGGYYCGALGWLTPEAAGGKPLCAKNPDPTPTPTNTILPGDICTKDTDCFNNANKVTCTGGK
jgi:hypothetical protein